MAKHKLTDIVDFFNRNPFYEMLEAEAKRVDLSFEQYNLLKLIDELGEGRGTDLAAAIGISRAAVSRRSWELQERNLVEEQQSNQDRRLRILKLTPTGKKLLDQMNQNYTQLIERMVTQMGQEKWAKFSDFLEEFESIAADTNYQIQVG